MSRTSPAVRIPVFFSLVVVLFFALSYGIDWLKEHYDVAPITISGGQLDKAVLAPGEPLRISLTVTRERLCHTVVARYVHSATGDVVAYQESIGGDAPIGTTRYAFLFNLPAGIKPGRYTFKGVVASTCGIRRYIETTPTFPFVVVGER